MENTKKDLTEEEIEIIKMNNKLFFETLGPDADWMGYREELSDD